jgi:hypothetical protein
VDSKELLEAQYLNRQPRAESAPSDCYYCPECELLYAPADTHEHYAPGFPSSTGKRQCPTCAGVVTYMGESDA